MMVQTLDRHPGSSGLIGLHIGAMNVKEYFPHDADTIELELDHLCIVCSLQPTFWLDKPEIQDVRLSCWLESKRTSGKLSPNSSSVALIPNGNRSFRLQILVKDEKETAVSAASEIPQPVVSKAPTVVHIPKTTHAVTSTVVTDRRRCSIEHSPERRKKVARLDVDEFASATAAN